MPGNPLFFRRRPETRFPPTRSRLPPSRWRRRIFGACFKTRHPCLRSMISGRRRRRTQAGESQNPPRISQDWIFMTPAEIMGVSSEQILQTRKRNENGQQENLSPMERYLEGRNPSARFDPSGNPSRSRDFWGQGNDQTNSDNSSLDLMNSDPDDLQSPTISGQPFDTAPGDTVSANPNKDSVWSKIFGTPAPQPAPSASTIAKQQAEMNQFQQLLNPGSVPVTAATTVPDNTTAFKSQNSLPMTDSTGNSVPPSRWLIPLAPLSPH